MIQPNKGRLVCSYTHKGELKTVWFFMYPDTEPRPDGEYGLRRNSFLVSSVAYVDRPWARDPNMIKFYPVADLNRMDDAFTTFNITKAFDDRHCNDCEFRFYCFTEGEIYG
jgi:hypothetical protein